MRNISPFNWRTEIQSTDIDAVGEDMMLTEKVLFPSRYNFPFKLDVTIAVICTCGHMKGTINLKPQHIEAPSMYIMMSDQVMQYEGVSGDFSGFFILMSDRFLESLFSSPQERLPLFLSVHENPYFPLNKEELNVITDYYYMLQKALRMKDNPYRIQTVKHLTQAFFYGNGYKYHPISSGPKRSRQEILVEEFIQKVKEHFKEHRGLDYYAEKLRLTPKHLSKVIKENTGKSASEWIGDYVILEAKALLKSTNMNIQQISDELNFPSQSFFGKYFKRSVGVSPKEYKKG